MYCSKCHTKFEERFILGTLAINVGGALIGLVNLQENPSSTVGHLLVNLFLIQLIILPSIVVHEFAHAIVGRLAGLTVLKIWIGRGKTLFRANLFGFDTEFKMIPVGGFTFLTHGLTEKLRFRYFLAILAGPASNAIILWIACRFVAWRDINIETSVQFGAIIVLAQGFSLVENLFPFRVQTALGSVCTDGLSLFQLLSSRSPDVLRPRLSIHVVQTAGGTNTWTT